MTAPRRLVCMALVLMWHVAPDAAAQHRGQATTEVVSLMTKDGVQLRLTYFPNTLPKGTAEAKQVTPVVLLHDFKGTRAIFTPLAQQLQVPDDGETDRPPFAVVAVDLRAHGDSTRQVLPSGETIDLDASKLRRDDFLAMATLDMEAVRNFLVGRNDAGELNLNKLCIVGTGMGASVAANWALQDWATPPLAIGKQGQDVKALALVSPPWTYSGLTFQRPMQFGPLKQNVAWLLMYGAEDAKARADVNRIHKPLERFHPQASNAGPQRSSRLRLVGYPSKLQGETLFQQLGTQIENEIVNFLVEHVAKTEQPWINRTGRLP